MPATNSAVVDLARAPLALPVPADSRIEFLRYFICSLLALLADMGLYWAGMKLGLGYPAAAATGFCVGLFAAYSLSVRWAFQDRRLNDSRIEFLLFASVGLLGLGLTELLLWALIGEGHLSPLMAKAATAGAVFVFNYGVRKALLFTRSPTKVAA